MRKRSRIIIGGLITALALAAAIGTANARRFELSEQHFLSHFTALTFEGGSINIVCAVSIEGSFHSRTLSKVRGQLIGYITEVHVRRPCTGGEAWALTTGEGRTESLPWHILYESFRGTLPAITGVELTLDNAAFIIQALGIECLYQATTAEPMKGIVNIGAGERATGLRANEAAPIPKHSGSGLCPSAGHLRGEGIVGTQVGYREIFVRLVQ